MSENNNKDSLFSEWERLREELIKLPGAMVKIGRVEYPTKVFWRAAAGRFNLSVKVADEECLDHGTPNETWVVNYTATHPGGRAQNGDGACSHSEKRSYERAPTGGVKFENGSPVLDVWGTLKNATTHNIRAHAHTRSYNRAVSNLIGHGELSAEEIQRGGPAPPDPEVKATPPARTAPAPTPPSTRIDPAPAAPPAQAKSMHFSKKAKPAPDPSVSILVERVEGILAESGLDPEYWDDAVYYASNLAYKGKMNFGLTEVRAGKYSKNQVQPMYGVLKRNLPKLLEISESKAISSGTRFQEVPF